MIDHFFFKDELVLVMFSFCQEFPVVISCKKHFEMMFKDFNFFFVEYEFAHPELVFHVQAADRYGWCHKNGFL